MNRRDFFRRTGGAVSSLAFTRMGLPAPRSRPNIVLIYADDLGYGDVGCYGATRVKTPNIDRIASGGLRFTNAHSASATCTPSRYALLTGEYAWRKKGTGILPGDAALIIEPGRVTLPSMLKKQGYNTAAIGKWHLGLGNGTIDWNGEIKPGPLEIGFDYSFIIPATLDRVPCVFVENHQVVNLDPKDPIRVSYKHPFPGEHTGKGNPELLRLKPSHGHNQAIINGVSRIGYMTGGKSALWVDETIVDVLSQKATAYIDQHKAEPFFLYYAAHDIHVPRLPNQRFVGKTGMGPRGDAIAEFDWSVGQILAALDRNGLTDNTLVILSSDNGPVLDDGYRDQAVEKLGSHKPAGPYRGGKYSNFDGGTRVPFIVRWPGHVKPDSVSSALIGQVDLLSSLAALTGQKLPEQAAPDSFNELPALLGTSKVGRPELVEDADVRSLVDGDWKLIQPSHRPKINKATNTELGNDTQPQLYNLSADPGEKDNLASQYPDRVRKMTAQLDRLRADRRSRP
ncbi:MAG TPA: arylsulfatase [Bryobacteraceae bacterium]